jgi:tetratricopeptide (TPR) repeat protein
MSLLHGVSTLVLHPGVRTRSTRVLLAIATVACCSLARASDPPAEVTLPVPPSAAVAPAANMSDAAPATGSRTAAYAEFRRLYDAKNYQAAAAQAKVVADLTEKELGANSEDLQVALMNLGISQYLSGDYVGAEASYLRAIELTEASGRPRIERLTRANAGLAATYYAGKRYDLAVQRFETALKLSRRSEGLLSDAQLPLLDKFSSALTELGRYADAEQLQRYSLRVVERKYGERDPRTAPTLEKIGRWYARVGAYEQAHGFLRRAIDIVEDAEGPRSPNLVGPLTALADCSRRQLLDPAQQKLAEPDIGRNTMFHDPSAPLPFSPGVTASEGQKALDRAVAIATERPDPSPVQVADVRTQYGDWFATRGQPERALPQYLLAWQAGSHVPYQGKSLADALFTKPVLLHYQRPAGWDRYSDRPSSEIMLKTVLLDVTVTSDGQASDITVIDDGGDKRRADQARAAAATARYRPRFENGQPVETRNVQFAQVFQVLVPKPEAPAPAPEPAPVPAPVPADKKS